VTIVGKADINDHGYGSVSLHVMEDSADPIVEREESGELILLLQCTNGETLTAHLQVGVRPRPQVIPRKRKQLVQTKINFCAEREEDRSALASLYAEPEIAPFGSYLERYKTALDICGEDCTYWGEKSTKGDVSVLSIEINAANVQLKDLMARCKTAEERVAAKERYVRDVVLDCYQHTFALDEIPKAVNDALADEIPDRARAAEIHLNHDKAVRTAAIEKTKDLSAAASA
jgi:hypothetical protein